MQWRIITGVDGSEVASGEVEVFGFDDHQARKQALRWVEQHPRFDNRIDPAVELGEIREADPDRDWSDWAEDHIYPYTGVGNPAATPGTTSRSPPARILGSSAARSTGATDDSGWGRLTTPGLIGSPSTATQHRSRLGHATPVGESARQTNSRSRSPA